MVKRFAITACVLVVLFAHLSVATAALVCDVPKFDFGCRTSTDGGYSHTFEICNTGAESVEIKALRSSCDCLTAEMERKTLAPHQRAVIDTHLIFEGLSGLQTRVLHLAYCDYKTPGAPLQVLSLSLSGFVLTPVLCEPAILDLGVVLPGCVATGSVRLLSGSAGPFALCAVGLDSTQNIAEYTPRLAATNHVLSLSIHPPARNGIFAGKALVTTSLPECPQLVLSYRGQVAPLIEASPSMIIARAKAALDVHIAFRSMHEIPFRVLSATATDPRIRTVIQVAAGNTTVHVTSLIAGSSLVDELVRVTTDNPVCHVIEIPVCCSYQR
ncbi:MAG: DUF1573 domain-containing protein [Kiritimatiellae bacterium]|jgi:hypothetical protein|nr:DUF1573 domain-containing protein [Kiritimatiellia bacterium]